MNIFQKILSSGVKDIADGVGGVIDAINAPGVKKEELKAQVLQIAEASKQRMMEAALASEKELTERLRIDMTSDSWLSKNIRPLALAFLTVVVSLLATLTVFLLSPAKLEILKVWVQLFTALLLTVYSFYFGGRTVEKMLKLVAELRGKK